MKTKNDLMWGLSLLFIGVATVILAGSNIIGTELPNAAKVIIGVVDLVALPILVYSTTQRVKNGQK